jgi:hypothetical protein
MNWKWKCLLVSCAALCSALGAGQASAGFVAVVTNGQGEANFGVGGSVPVIASGTLDGFAVAHVGKRVVKTATSTKKPPAAGDTNVAADALGGTVATARVKWKVTAIGLDATSFSVGTGGTFAKVDPVGKEQGVASIQLKDAPLVYDNAAGVTFHPTYSLLGDFQIGALGMNSHSTVNTDAGSNLPGLASFFTLSMSLDGSNPGDLSISFISNPLLGLNDGAIENSIRAHLMFDSSTGTYSNTSDFNYLSLILTAPATENEVAFSWNTSASAMAGPAPVPEPSTLTLLGLGTTSLLGYGWRRRKQALA